MSGGIFSLGGCRLERRAVQRVRVAQRRRLGGLDRVREDACQSLRRSGRAAAGHCHRRGTQAERGTKPLLLERGAAPSTEIFRSEFVKTHAKACVDQGAPLRVIVTAEERKRNAEQNRYYWSAVLRLQPKS